MMNDHVDFFCLTTTHSRFVVVKQGTQDVWEEVASFPEQHSAHTYIDECGGNELKVFDTTLLDEDG